MEAFLRVQYFPKKALLFIIPSTIIHGISFNGIIMKHYKYKKFASEAKKSDIHDEFLKEVLTEFLSLDDKGRQKYALGAGLYKIRLASAAGRGKRAGSRSLLAFSKGNKIIWLHLFAKNDKANVTNTELVKLKKLATILLSLDANGIEKLCALGELYEVDDNE